jgi:phage shock protein C
MNEKKLLGVCAWLADKTNFDVTWVRLGFVFATLLGLGAPVLVYLVLFVLLELNWII